MSTCYIHVYLTLIKRQAVVYTKLWIWAPKLYDYPTKLFITNLRHFNFLHYQLSSSQPQQQAGKRLLLTDSVTKPPSQLITLAASISLPCWRMPLVYVQSVHIISSSNPPVPRIRFLCVRGGLVQQRCVLAPSHSPARQTQSTTQLTECMSRIPEPFWPVYNSIFWQCKHYVFGCYAVFWLCVTWTYILQKLYIKTDSWSQYNI